MSSVILKPGARGRRPAWRWTWRSIEEGHRVPGCGVHELVEGLQEAGLLDLGLDVASTDRTLAVRRADPVSSTH